MPRCMTSVSPDDSGTTRYFARRSTASAVVRVSRAANRGGKGVRAIGSLDRLLTCARGAMLSGAHLLAAKQEGTPDPDLTADDLLAAFDAAVERALDQLRGTAERTLGEGRHVGRAKLPTTVAG